MVHKKYLKINGKTYGPYYYESYREGGKIKKRYLKAPPIKESRVNEKNFGRKFSPEKMIMLYALFFSILLIATIAYYATPNYFFKTGVFSKQKLFLSPLGASSGGTGSVNLTIWDDTDEPDVERYSLCNLYCAQKNKPSSVLWNAFFFANYTDNDGNVIDNANGNCILGHNISGVISVYENMNYNAANFLWELNTSFNQKGTFGFEVNCTSSQGEIVLYNNFIITNTIPYVIKTASGFIDFDGNGVKDTLYCTEDSVCSYGFGANVSDDDFNDILVFNYAANVNTTLTNFTLDSLTGLLKINVTTDANSGARRIELNVQDSESPTISALLDVYIGPVNDAPVFFNLVNKSFNMSELFEYVIVANDEENNFPLIFNITFLSCETAQWSSRGSTNCELFDSSQYSSNGTSMNISFTPTKNDVGNYIINFNVQDTNSLVEPKNASSSVIVNFSVINTNDPPYLTYVCDNERVSVEDVPFICYINASDSDEINNLTFSSDRAWFLNSKNVAVNITTDFKGSININFVPGDANVGNWAINVSVKDTGSPRRSNSTIINFSVENVNDSVDLDSIQNVTAFTSNYHYTIYVNAIDEDLKIPDKGVYNEVLSFSSDNSCVEVAPYRVVSGTNITTAQIDFNSNCFAAGDYNITINASDLSGNIDSESFIITIVGNNPPIWAPNTETIHRLTEDVPFYLNLSENVSDADGDSIVFSFTNDTSFPYFRLNESTGVISFIPSDEDVGQHISNISASDGKTPVYLIFNFTIINVIDAPIIEKPLNGNGITINSTTLNMNASEDMEVEIFLTVRDDDFKIPLLQRDFYSESLSIGLNFSGPNSNLFSFGEPVFLAADRLLYDADFIPRKTDVGFYNVLLNVSDARSASSSVEFNLSIFEINHPPVFTNLANQSTYINKEFYYDINANDMEEGDDSSGTLTYSYVFLSGADFINHDENIFNTKTGVLNLTFSGSKGAKYHLSVSVNDSAGLQNTGDFWIFVYDVPEILAPLSSYIFNLKENNETNLTFRVNHTIGNELNYKFYVGDILRHEDNYSGNASIVLWEFLPGFNDETYGLFGNLTLVVSVPVFPNLNSSMTWNTNITHASAPMQFIKAIGDKQGVYGTDIVIDLKEHFYDADAFDPHYNESVSFVVKSNTTSSGVSFNINNWVLSLGASSVLVEMLNITASDLDGNRRAWTNATSNDFEIEFKEPTEIEVQLPIPTSGGGGGGAQEKLVSLKIIVPDVVSIKKGEKIILPVSIVNDGSTILNGIDLSGLMVKDGDVLNDFKVEFSESSFSTLRPGERENITLSVNTSLDELGLYELTVNGKVRSPKYLDWGKIYIKVQEGGTIIERLVFTEEFIVENPECIELKELIDESRGYLASGDVNSAEEKLDEAVNSCKEAISQESLISIGKMKIKLQDEVFIYLFIATIIAIVFGISYYVYQRRMFNRALASVEKIDSNAGPSEHF